MAGTGRRRDPEGKRLALLAAAARVFADKGLAASTVSDIVKAAGVAQGTFYLYFPTKDAVVDALVEQAADGLMSMVDSATASGGSATGRFLALRDVLTAEASDPSQRPLLEFMHHPANAAIHHRMAEQLVGQLSAVVESIVEQGVAEGSFHVDDPRVAAWFVLSGLQSIELASATADDMPAAIRQVTALALRALGFEEPDER